MIGYRCRHQYASGVSCTWVTEHEDPQDVVTCKRCGSSEIELLSTAGMEAAIANREVKQCPACRVFHTP